VLKFLHTKPDEYYSSRQVWEQPEVEASRASVINFLTKMAETGFLDLQVKTGKGGHRGLYSAMFYDLDDLKNQLFRMFISHMRQELNIEPTRHYGE
jgi:hypothetical protein